MLELALGLLFAGTATVLAVVLPILSFIRAQQARRLAEELRQRMDALEAGLRALSKRSAEQAPSPPRPAPADTPPAARAVPPTAPQPARPEAARSPLPPAPPPASPPAPSGEGLEQLIGGRWLLYVGIAGLVLGMSYFVKFAFDNGWVSEELRVAAGVVTGLALIAGGIRFSRRGLELFGQALCGGGIVVLYVAIYAALHFYALLTPAPAFALMVIVTAAAAFLAHLERAQVLAMLAVLGGFATPLLIGGDRSVQLVLFSYIGILIAGTVVLVRLHGWPFLSVAAYGCTFVLVLLWLISSYERTAWLRTELFLVAYLAMFLYLLWTLRKRGESSPASLFARMALGSVPLLFHAASLFLLTGHTAALLFYFFIYTVGGLIAAAATGYVAIRLATLVIVGLPLMVWMTTLASPRWHLPAVVTACFIYVLHLASQWHALHDAPDEDLPLAEAAHAQMNGLLLPLTLYLFTETRFAWWNAREMFALAAVNAAIAFAIRTGARQLQRHYIALAAMLTAIGVALAFDGPVVALGWTLEGVVLAWLALTDRSRLVATASAVMISLGAAQLIIQLQQPLAVHSLPLLNPRAAVALMIIAALAWLAWRMRHDTEDHVRGQIRDVVIILANLLALGLLSADIHAFFSQRVLDAAADTQAAVDARLMQQASLSIAWAAYAVTLIALGIRRQYAPARYLAIALLALTIVKVMAVDIAQLDRLYRMLSVLAVGVLLVAASYLYQRRRTH